MPAAAGPVIEFDQLLELFSAENGTAIRD